MRWRKHSRKLTKHSELKVWLGIGAVMLILELIAENPWWLLAIPAIFSILGYRRYSKWKRSHQERRRILLSSIDEVDHMSGVQFEERFALHFRTLGWKVLLTKKSGDNGANLVATDPRGNKWAIQAKRYEKSVGVHAVYEVLGGKAAYDASEALVVTNRKLTRSARELAKKAGVEVWEREQLINAFREVAKKIEKRSG